MPKAQDDELVMGLVERTMARPPDERDAYIHTACDGDTELIAQVRNYVHWETTMDRFLLDPIYSLAAVEHRFEPGERLAHRFRIVRLVAEGGMGVVYEAWDEKLERRIAIKSAKTGFDKHLPPEVRHASEISHPNVCKIFEIHTAFLAHGEVDFFTMEFLEGETLADRLRQGPLPESEARSIARQISAGLAEAHRHGVIHGDLKSNNVILARETTGGDVRAVITDFGLARRPAASSAGGSLQSAEAGGAPDYMAPELWKGQKASTASDVYALGVMLYELESGRRPFGLEVPLEDRSTRITTPLHGKWGPILTRCLDPDPARRFQDAGEVAQALAPRRALPWWLMAAAALLAIVVGVVTYQRATAPSLAWQLAMLPIEASSDDTATLARELARDTAVQLRRIKGGRVARLTFVDASQNADAARQATHQLKATLTKENGKLILRSVITDAHSGVKGKEWAAAFNPGDVRGYVPAALAGMVTGTLRVPPLPVAPVKRKAEQGYWAGVWYTRQNTTLDAALQALKQAVEEDPDSPLTYAALAEAQWFQFYVTRDPASLENAKDSLREAEARNPDVPAAHRVEGYLYYAADLYSQAVSEFERAIELQPGNAMAYIYLGRAYEDNNQIDKALAEFAKATDVEPNYFRTWQNLANYYQNRSNFILMARYHKKAVDLAPYEPNLHTNLGGAYMILGKFPEAESELRRSVELQETPAAYSDLGQILIYNSKYQEAVQSFKRALELHTPTGGTPRYLVLMYLGIADRRSQQDKDARDANIEGLKMVEAENPRSARDGDLKSFLGYFSAACGDRKHAIDYIETALSLFPDNSATRWRAVLTYEELYRQSRDAGLRKRTLELLGQATVDQLADFHRWPDLADLHEDPRFKDLLLSHQVE